MRRALYAVACGMGAKRTGDAVIEFNLVPENLRNRSRTAVNWLRVGTIFAVAITLLAVSGSIINRMNLAIYQQELVAQRPALKTWKTSSDNLRDLRARESGSFPTSSPGCEALRDESETSGFLGFLNQLAAATHGSNPPRND